MTNLRDGARVSYIGDGRTGRTLGEHGQVLYITGSGGHVKWADEKITLEDLHDLGPVNPLRGVAAREERDELADSLDVGPIQAVGVRAVYESEGETGVIGMLATRNQLTGFPTIAQDTLRFVEHRVRDEPALRAAAADLNPDEADRLFHTAAWALLSDSFGAGDD